MKRKETAALPNEATQKATDCAIDDAISRASLLGDAASQFALNGGAQKAAYAERECAFIAGANWEKDQHEKNAAPAP